MSTIVVGDRVTTEHGTGIVRAISTSGGHHTCVDVELDEPGARYARWIALPESAIQRIPGDDA